MSDMTLEARVQRLEDIEAINQLMARRAYIHSAGMHARELDECWVKETPDPTFEPEDWGMWVGIESIRKAYVDGAPPVEAGMMIEHTLTTGVVEVARDRKTAKGVWMSPGHETFPMPEGLPLPHWSWGRYSVDFALEHGEWKIWHLHVLTTFRTPYDQDWVDSSINRPKHFPPLGETLPGMYPPDRPVTFNQPYTVDAEPAYQPEPPMPYDTFDEADSYAAVPARVQRKSDTTDAGER
jgi:hypothetical protein